MDKIFVFDLDSTITKKEILPEIASLIGEKALMQNLTTHAMQNNDGFADNFLRRLKIIKDIDLFKIQKTVEKIEVFEKIADFIKENKDNCLIITGNLDLYIIGLMKRLKMENNYFSSKANVKNGKVNDIISVLNKNEIIRKIDKNNKKIICIGDGTNDIDMIKYADIGIAFSAVHKVCDELNKVSNYNIDNEEELYKLLKAISEN